MGTLVDVFEREMAAKGKSWSSGMTQADIDTYNAISGITDPTPDSERITALWQQLASDDPARWGNPNAGKRTTGGNGFYDALPWSSAGREDFNNMIPGLSIMALPFAAAGGAALAGGAGAGAGAAGGAAGTGTVAGTTAAGTTAAGTGAAGGGLFGTGITAGQVGTGASLASLAGGEFGGGDYAGDTTYTNADGSSFDPSVPYNDPGFTGDSPDQVSPGMLQQAQEMAKQFGITPASALQALLRATPGIVGAFGANQQANSLSALSDKYMAFGAPSRARYEASFAPGFTMENDPGYKGALDQSAKATQHALSVRGNPAGSPNAWATSLNDLYAKTAYPALQNFRNTNANAGGIASLQTAAPAAATGAIQSQADIFNSLGSAANSIFNPPKSLAEQYDEFLRLRKAA